MLKYFNFSVQYTCLEIHIRCTITNYEDGRAGDRVVAVKMSTGSLLWGKENVKIVLMVAQL